ncbi:hypothetical protein [Saccharopolyspora montiporae]|uniref:hypothetical protein n=1 Tax=Saccharopolyspora montiporae TaxID=2781240 RepID=UPI001D155BAD|nr:hypothetical protein [Saccharopolyspora sp. HNM0983]
MSVQETVGLVLAQGFGPSDDPGGQGEDFGKSSPVGLLLLVVFAISIVLLVRSMTKHLKRLPVNFDQGKADAAAPARATADADPDGQDADPVGGGAGTEPGSTESPGRDKSSGDT